MTRKDGWVILRLSVPFLETRFSLREHITLSKMTHLLPWNSVSTDNVCSGAIRADVVRHDCAVTCGNMNRRRRTHPWCLHFAIKK